MAFAWQTDPSGGALPEKTNSPLVQVDQLQVGETRHRDGVVRLWEQDPQPLLQKPSAVALGYFG
ncbi:hypothetical protein AAF134_06385 [Synechococcus lacustris Tous-12m]